MNKLIIPFLLFAVGLPALLFFSSMAGGLVGAFHDPRMLAVGIPLVALYGTIKR